MSETVDQTIDKNTWVEIHAVVLPAGERAAQVPADTASVPLEMRVKGFLTAPSTIGDEVEIMTAAGRCLSGKLLAANPAYTHGFGTPAAELLPVGREVRAILRDRGIVK